MSTNSTYRGLQTLLWENAYPLLVTLPELCGKAWQITCSRSNREFPWHNDSLHGRHVIQADGRADGRRRPPSASAAGAGRIPTSQTTPAGDIV